MRRLPLWSLALVGVGLAASPRSAHAQANAAPASLPSPGLIARLVGVELGASARELISSVAPRGLRCAWARHDALVCELPGASGRGVVATTYWLTAGAVSSVYETSDLGSTDDPATEGFAPWAAAHRVLVERVEAVLGAPGEAADFAVAGFAELGDAQKVRVLEHGQAALEQVWRLPAAQVRASLRGERGRPRLVLSVEPAPAPGLPEAGAPVVCTSDAVATAAFGLFAPDPARRAASARVLGACRVADATPALARALGGEEDAAARLATVTAMGEVGNPAGLQALRDALAKVTPAEPTPDLRRALVAALARTGDPAPAAATLADRQSDDESRAAALLALVAAGALPSAEALGAARDGAGPKLAAALNAAASASATAASPPTVLGKSGAVSPPAPAGPVALPAPGAALPPPVPFAPGVTRGSMPPSAPAPPAPTGSVDGTALAITSSILVGGAWGGSLSLLADQRSTGVVMLIGSAGAVIGGGTAWGLTRFGLRPTREQALFYTHALANGALAGWLAYAGSGASDERLKWGLLVGGESLGVVAGIAGARLWAWRPQQLVLANSLLVAAGLGGLGLRRTIFPERPIEVTPLTGYGAAPAAILAAVASRHLTLSSDDPLFMLSAAAGTGWTAGLVASGASDTEPLGHGRGQGAMIAGLGLGYIGATALASLVEVSPRAIGRTAGTMVAGNLLGLGIHMLAAPDSSGRWALGAGLSGVGLELLRNRAVAAGILRPGPAAAAMGLSGGAYGALTWLGALVASSSGEPDARVPGGALTFGITGLVAGVVASSSFQPDAADLATTTVGTGMGGLAGLGVARLAVAERGVADFAGVAGGAALGLAGSAAFAHADRLRPPDVGAGLVGAGHGLLWGTLLPSLTEPMFGPGRTTQGGALLGLSAGAIGAMAFAHGVRATSAQVTVPTAAGLLGLGIGTGVGMLSPVEGTRSTRIGAVAGSAGLLAASLALEPRLRLATEIGPDALRLGLAGAMVGGFHGWLAVDVVTPDPEGALGDRQRVGGTLAGASAGLASGFVLSKWLRPDGYDTFAVLTGSALGHSMGLGVGHLALDAVPPSDSSARTAPALRLGGAALGLAGTAAFVHDRPLRGADVAAGIEGGLLGATVGALAPTLRDDAFAGGRATTGAAHLGLAVGAFGGAAWSHAADATAGDLVRTTTGVLDGALTGLGYGMLLDRDGTTRGRRTGLVLGSVGGLAIGSAAWPRVQMGPGDGGLVFGLMSLGAWNGYWLPSLGQAAKADVRTQDRWGGVLAGAGTGSFLGTALAPLVEVDPDRAGNALGMNVLLGGAGAGAGAMASARHDAVAGGLLAGGAAGLLLGGALHEHIEVSGDDTPLLTLAAVEGAWIGAWAPQLVLTSDDLQSRHVIGGLAAGGLGTLAVAALATDAAPLASDRASLGVTGSAVGAAIFGGGALLGDDLDSQGRVALLLGGSALGLGGGLALAPYLDFRARAVRHAALGAALGAGEGLVFAWAGRGDSARDTAGGALVGAGMGTTLGLASAAASSFTAQRGLAAAGFGAWGAWIGSFGGALANRDAHEVTLGGLAGLNVGVLTGYGLLRSEVVAPSDFGWLSLFGAAGTAVGGGVGAVLSSKVDPRPVLAGLAAGPLVGMGVGALVLPRLRTIGGAAGSTSSAPAPLASSSARLRTMRLASAAYVADGVGNGVAADANLGAVPTAPDGSSITSVALRERHPREAGLLRPVLHRLRQVVDVGQVVPIVGALPAPRGTATEDGAPPLMVGLAGTLR
jgi:hypothetical protein